MALLPNCHGGVFKGAGLWIADVGRRKQEAKKIEQKEQYEKEMLLQSVLKNKSFAFLFSAVIH